MQSKGNQPNACQKRWREEVRQLGSIISNEPAIIHHCVGTSAKHNKVAIGHEFIIPLTDEEHKALHQGDIMILDGRSRKEFEKNAFYEVCALLHDHPDRPSHEIIEAIMDYRM